MSIDKPDFQSFEATVNALFSRVRGHIEPGAHRMQRLLGSELLSRLDSIPTILVGGTNGKGTTCAVLENTLRTSGFKTALYTSPHLVSPTERIRFDGRPISKKAFLNCAKIAFDNAQQRLPDATFFELMTALAFQLVAERKPDVFVCEVGLGGRLDSTNALSPVVSVLTSVGLDHTEYLGPTEDLIGFEKSFISRRNRPFVIGGISEPARRGIEKALAVTGAEPCFVDTTVDRKNIGRVPAVTYQLCQTIFEKLSKTTHVRINVEQLKAGAESTHWPGRFDVRWVDNTPVVLDGAHNAHGVAFFLGECARQSHLSQLPKPWIFAYATLSDKTWNDCLKMLIPKADKFIFSQTQSARAVPAGELLTYTQSIQASGEFVVRESSSNALDEALRVAKDQRGTLFVLGSLTLIGEALEHFKLPVFLEFASEDEC